MARFIFFEVRQRRRRYRWFGCETPVRWRRQISFHHQCGQSASFFGLQESLHPICRLAGRQRPLEGPIGRMNPMPELGDTRRPIASSDAFVGLLRVVALAAVGGVLLLVESTLSFRRYTLIISASSSREKPVSTLLSSCGRHISVSSSGHSPDGRTVAWIRRRRQPSETRLRLIRKRTRDGSPTPTRQTRTLISFSVF